METLIRWDRISIVYPLQMIIPVPLPQQQTFEVIEPPLISIDSESSTPIQCFGSNDGSITVEALGGTPPYRYTLNPGGIYDPSGVFTGLTPALGYQVTVTDTNNCLPVSSTSVDMVEPAIITLDGVDTSDVNCNGAGNGSLSVLAGGGTPPYTYTLSPGSLSQPTGDFDDLIGGTYLVSVTDSRTCPSASVTDLVINDPDPISISSIDTTDVTCNGASDGTVIVTASGGTGTLYYTLTPVTGPAINNTDGNFTGLPGEIYSLSITDVNACNPATASNLVVFEPPAISIDLEESTKISCFGANDASIKITASGGTGTLTYTLRDPAVVAVNQTGLFENLSPGPYTVGVDDDNGCGPLYSNAFTFVEPTPLAVTVDGTSSKVLACFGDSTGSLDITVTGGTAPYNFSWTGPNAYINNIEDISGLKAGDYNLILTDANSCLLDSIPLDSITEPPQLTMSTNKDDISCFGSGDGTVTITAGGGTPPYQYKRTGFPYTGSNSFSALNPGPYTFFTKDNNGCETSQQDTILQPQEIKINQVIEDNANQRCNGDSNGIITITAIGGTGMLEYSIDTGITYFPNNVFTNLAGGSYHVYVRDANLCTVIGGEPLIQNPPLLYIKNYSQPDTSTCFASPEGSVFIEGGGGSFPMKYILNETDTSMTGFFENLTEGPHDLQVLDTKGCTRDTTVLLHAPPPIITSTLITHVTTCHEDSSGVIAIIATGGTGLTKSYLFEGNTTYQHGYCIL